MYRYFFVVAQSGTAIIDEECITRPSAKQTKKIVKDYGDSHLFSTLCSLVNMRLLANGPHWTLSNPTYFCAIDGSLADDKEVNNICKPTCCLCLLMPFL